MIKFCVSLILFVFFSSTLSAQPDDTYIKRLTGDINAAWLNSVGKTIPVQNLQWKIRRVHGFNATVKDARKQSLLSQAWYFYENKGDTSQLNGVKVELPHDFADNRDYFSAWYVSNLFMTKNKGKRYFLKLNRIEMFSLVYLNGQVIGHHFGGLTPFEFEISEVLQEGNNTLAIFVYDKSASYDGDRIYNQFGITRLTQYNPDSSACKLPGGMRDIPIIEERESNFVQDVFVKTSTRNGEMAIEFELPPDGLNSNSTLSFEVLKWPNGETVDIDLPIIDLQKNTAGIQTKTVKWDNAELWSPDNPNLYVLRTKLSTNKVSDVLETRFGFREFWVEGKQFMLNGVPIRLRGESHYHPMRYDPDFHREVFKLHTRLFGTNACRVHAFMPPGDVMLGADEAGMLIVDQSAVWSLNAREYARGGEWLAKNLEQEFAEWVKRDRNCPSVVIWDVENEMLRFNFEMQLPWISKLRGYVEKYDTTRPINYSGAGWFSDDQQMVSLHMQDHYSRIMNDWKTKGTRPLIMGEFWIGGRANQRLPHAPEFKSVHQRYLEEALLYERNLLEMRYMGVAGLMPFRISLLTLFQTPHSTKGYMFSSPNKLKVKTQPQDVLNKIRHALQPVTLFFWPRQTYAQADKVFERELIICNDGETSDDFEISWKWDGKVSKSKKLRLQAAEQKRFVIEEEMPLSSNYIIASIRKNNVEISADTLLINPIELAPLKNEKTLQIYNDSNLANLLSNNGFKAVSNANIPRVNDNVIWVIPERANNRELAALKPNILNYLSKGGMVLSLKQDEAPVWFPVKFQFWSALLSPLHTYKAMGWEGLNRDLRFGKEATILAGSHPVFSGIQSSSLLLWDTFDGRVSDDVLVRPSILNKYEPGNWRPLASASIRSHVSLAEMFYGKGTLMACQLNVIENINNIQAKRLFANMVDYLSNKQPAVLAHKLKLEGNIKGNDFAKELGFSEAALKGASVKRGDVMLALDGTRLSEINNWTLQGGKVMILSENLVQHFNGVSLSDETTSLVVTKVSDHPLLFGVSSANFLDEKSAVLSRYFTSIPSNARVLLQGFKGQGDLWKVGDAEPVMISIPYAKGEILLAPMHINTQLDASTKELLCLLLTNCGVSVPYVEPELDDIIIKKTIPLAIDGNFSDWLDDMDDRLVSPYQHAQPIYLTIQDKLEGTASSDLNLSTINYLFWNEQALYLAGIVFSEEKNSLSSIVYGAEKAYQLTAKYNNDEIKIIFKKNMAQLEINGKLYSDIPVGTGQIDSKEMTDADRLQFSYIVGGGQIETIPNLIGETFEVMIPWDNLKSTPSDISSKALFRIESKGSVLQMPLGAALDQRDSWLTLKLNQKGK